jgi:hypothetical protein
VAARVSCLPVLIGVVEVLLGVLDLTHVHQRFSINSPTERFPDFQKTTYRIEQKPAQIHDSHRDVSRSCGEYEKPKEFGGGEKRGGDARSTLERMRFSRRNAWQESPRGHDGRHGRETEAGDLASCVEGAGRAPSYRGNGGSTRMGEGGIAGQRVQGRGVQAMVAKYGMVRTYHGRGYRLPWNGAGLTAGWEEERSCDLPVGWGGTRGQLCAWPGACGSGCGCGSGSERRQSDGFRWRRGWKSDGRDGGGGMVVLVYTIALRISRDIYTILKSKFDRSKCQHDCIYLFIILFKQKFLNMSFVHTKNKYFKKIVSSV